MGSARRAVVLVVEDEPLLRIAAVDMIEGAGFDTVEAPDASEAVAILEKRTDIRIVFTDIDMPRGMDGMKLAACIRDRWPPIDIILCSGRFVPRPEDMPPRARFFSKPVRDREVLDLMRHMTA